MSARGRSGKGKAGREPGQSQTARAGLQMPVARVQRYMRNGNYAKHCARVAGVYLAAVLEYCTAEILELAGNACKDNNRKTINPRHIMLAIKNDEELSRLLSNVTIRNGGVLPNIHKSLLPAKKGKKGGKN